LGSGRALNEKGPHGPISTEIREVLALSTAAEGDYLEIMQQNQRYKNAVL
jgi:hypothetical protein